MSKKLKDGIESQSKQKMFDGINDVLFKILKVSKTKNEQGTFTDVGAALKATEMLIKLNNLTSVGSKKKPIMWHTFPYDIFEKVENFEQAIRACQLYCSQYDHPFTLHNFMIFCGVTPSMFEKRRFDANYQTLYETLMTLTESHVVDAAMTSRYNSAATKMLLEKQYNYEREEKAGETVIKIEHISSRDEAESFKRK